MKIRIVLSFAALLSGAVLFAQSPKIGYTNAEYILSLLPEAKQIESELKDYEAQLQKQMQTKYQELQVKLEDYQKNATSYNDVVRADKEAELQNLQQSLQEFQVNAEQSMNKKRNTLLSPAVEKIGNAIQSVAEENNYDFIFSVGAPGLDILLYGKEDHDVSNQVLAKLGITPPSNSGN